MLSKFVKPGGVLYVWVYAKRFNPFRFVKDVLDALRVTRLPEPALHALVGHSPTFRWHLSGSTRPRGQYLRCDRAHDGASERPSCTVRELQLTWFDALSPEYDSRHSEEEVVGWFEACGYTDIRAIEEPKVGVRGIAPSRTRGDV